MDTPQKYDDRAVVYARNDSGKPFRARYAKVWYELQPGETKMVPWHAMRLWHGNPFAEDLDSRRRYRTEEWERVRAKWGVYEHDDQLDRIPAITYTDIETSEPWVTVADDPDGLQLPSNSHSETGERNLLAMIEKMGAEIAELKSAKGAPPADDSPVELYDQAEDSDMPGPEVAPRPKTKAAVVHDGPPE